MPQGGLAARAQHSPRRDAAAAAPPAEADVAAHAACRWLKPMQARIPVPIQQQSPCRVPPGDPP